MMPLEARAIEDFHTWRYLFFSQGFHGIYLCGSARGHIASQQGRGKQDHRDGAECRDIDGPNLIPHSPHDSAHGHRAAQTERQSHQGQRHTFAHDLRQDAVLSGSQCHPQPDFVRSLRHSERHNSVDPESCEHESDRGKDSEKYGMKSVLRP